MGSLDYGNWSASVQFGSYHFDLHLLQYKSGNMPNENTVLRYDAIQYDKIQHNAMQYTIIQCDAIQCNTIS